MYKNISPADKQPFPGSLSLCIFLALGLFCTLSQALVFNGDNRELLTANEEIKYYQTGGIDTANLSGSAIVIGDNCDVAITTAHLLYDSKTGTRKYNQIRFLPNLPSIAHYYDGDLVETGFDDIPESRFPYKGSGRDWAIIRLRKPAFDRCYRIKVKPYKTSCNARINIVGRHRDDMEHKRISKNCWLAEDDNSFEYINGASTVVKHNCDTKSGASGAPLLCEEGSNIYVIGIHYGNNYTRHSGAAKGLVAQDPSYRSAAYFNIALLIDGDFGKALQMELDLSKQRRQPGFSVESEIQLPQKKYIALNDVSISATETSASPAAGSRDGNPALPAILAALNEQPAPAAGTAHIPSTITAPSEPAYEAVADKQPENPDIYTAEPENNTPVQPIQLSGISKLDVHTELQQAPIRNIRQKKQTDNDGDWSINIASFLREPNAEKMRSSSLDKGVSTTVATATVNGKTYYRLRVTGFESREAAMAQSTTIKEQLGLEEVWITKK